MLLAPYVCLIFLVKGTEWPPIGKTAAHSAYEMFSWYKYLIVSLVFSHPGFWSWNLFLIAPLIFAYLYLLIHKYILNQVIVFFLNKHETNLKFLYMMDRTSSVFNDNCSQQTEVVTLSLTSVHER